LMVVVLRCGLWPGVDFVQKYDEVVPVLDAVWEMGRTIEAGCEKNDARGSHRVGRTESHAPKDLL